MAYANLESSASVAVYLATLDANVILLYRVGQKSSHYGSLSISLKRYLRDFWCTSTTFCSKHICQFYIEQIITSAAPRSDKFNSVFFTCKIKKTTAFK